MELDGLRERVLALVGVETSSTSCGALGVDALQDAPAPSSAPPSDATGCAAARRCPPTARRCRARAPTAARRTRPRPDRRRPAVRRMRRRSAPPRPAAARPRRSGKYRPAASMTLLPSSASRRASLPMVVVLPEPLTPTTRMTNGFLLPIDHERPGAGLSISRPHRAAPSTSAATSAELPARDALRAGSRGCTASRRRRHRRRGAASQALRESAHRSPPLEQVGQIECEPGVAAIEAARRRLKKPWRFLGRGGDVFGRLRPNMGEYLLCSVS